ncbi:MAG: tRNA 2-thiouridine(34) synthase MnmA [bacterium]|nr:tRNA 2-thiouridine(34) synthase MnmA [bacterium]
MAVAMSGGVDSSVAAALLVRQGFEVIGLTMHLWTDPKGEELSLNRSSGCCSVTMSRDAAAVADRLGFRHYVLDLSREFHDSVVRDFRDEYFAGRTPNPCVRCNTFVKWQTLLARARQMGCDYLATGHYARSDHHGERARLLRARFLDKDQSYALWGLDQDSLCHTVFPLGELTKPEVRKIAAELGLKTADKPESQDICFIPDDDYGRFLRTDGGTGLPVLEAGEIIGPEDKILGRHRGIAYYTVGQRKGLGVAAERPLYVTRIDPHKNRVYVGWEDDCFSDTATAAHVNWVSIGCPGEPIPCQVKVRYRDHGHGARVTAVDEQTVRMDFDRPVRAVTPGQSAVFYQGDVVLGGGVISEFNSVRKP